MAETIADLECGSAEKELIRLIPSIAMSYDPIRIFNDFVEMSALAMANACDLSNGSVYRAREAQYLGVSQKYKRAELDKMSEAFGLLAIALEESPHDILGNVFMQIGASYGGLGQFFTPYHLSCLTAALGIDIKAVRASDSPVQLSEPSCGGGGMIIASAMYLKQNGIDYQRRMKVTAQDLDWKAVYMCYVQLSLLGIKAKVVQGSTLTAPYDHNKTDESHVFVTPAEAGLLWQI